MFINPYFVVKVVILCLTKAVSFHLSIFCHFIFIKSINRLEPSKAPTAILNRNDLILGQGVGQNIGWQEFENECLNTPKDFRHFSEK